ncbi:SigE family RNA polymerase sigma factor [Nocardioides sp.]|uniref:SigE family RNA polymerase sigma factor n=1 Tax=Nocardioides sp. TaxID=35761 RepID=UPI0026112ECB|nr:SigE family RNA polymerase sigma factor [Nocardioides sp.]
MEPQAESAFAAFVDDSWTSLVRAAVFLGASPSDADDIAQTTVIRCYRGWEKVSGADNRDAYVYRMLLHCLRDHQRTSWWRLRSPSPPDPHGPAGPDESARIEMADAVHRALEVLPRAQREVVVLRYFVQLTEAQTAATLGIAAGTVKSRLSRSLARLASDPHLLDLTGGTR